MTALLRRCALALALLLALPSAADEEGPVSVTEKDFGTWRALREAEALHSARQFRWRAYPEKMKRAGAERDAAWKKSGWTREKWDRVSSALNDAVQALSAVDEAAPEDKASAKENVDQMDKTTVGTVKAHRGEINDDLSSKFEQRVAAGDQAEREGRAPTVDELQGTWVADFDATIESMGGGILQGEAKEKAKADMHKASGDVSYTFGGDKVETKSNRGVEKGTFRLEGSTIHFKPERSKREQKLEAGLLGDGTLRLGRGFAGLIFRKK